MPAWLYDINLLLLIRHPNYHKRKRERALTQYLPNSEAVPYGADFSWLGRGVVTLDGV